MNSQSKARAGIVVAGTALAAALTLGFAAPAVAAPTDDEIFAVNSGSITLELGSEYVGDTVTVYSQIPGQFDAVLPVTGEVAEDGTITLENLSGPVLISTISASDPDAMEMPLGVAFINRHGETDFNFDGTDLALVNATGPVVPTYDELQLMPLIADYNFTPTEYESGVAFTASMLDVIAIFDDALVEGAVASSYMYTTAGGTSIATGTAVTGGAFDIAIGAEWTSAPHDLAVFDEYGRLLAALTLDGGVAVEDEQPGVVGSETGPQLAETGAEQTGLLLGVGAGLLALGAAVFLVARAARLRSSAE